MPVFGIHTSEEKEQAARIAELEARIKELEQKNSELEKSLEAAREEQKETQKQLEETEKENDSNKKLLKTQAAKHVDEKLGLSYRLDEMDRRYASAHAKGVRAIDVKPKMRGYEAEEQLYRLIKTAEESARGGKKIDIDPNEVEIMISSLNDGINEDAGYRLLKLCASHPDSHWAKPVISSIFVGAGKDTVKGLLGCYDVRDSFRELYHDGRLGTLGNGKDTKADVVELWDYAVSQITPSQVDFMKGLITPDNRVAKDKRDITAFFLIYLLAKNGVLDKDPRFKEFKKDIEKILPKISNPDEARYLKILANYKGAREDALRSQFITPSTTMLFEECQHALDKGEGFSKLVGRKGEEFAKKCQLYRVLTGQELYELCANSKEGKAKNAPHYKEIQEKIEKELKAQEAVEKKNKTERRLGSLRK